MSAPDTSRINAFDGLRGWAALSVVISHSLNESFKFKFPEVVNFATAILVGGAFAVAIFFTISGYVLTIRRWNNPANPPLYVAFVRRYIRLTIPIIGATFLAWALISLGQAPVKANVGEWFGFTFTFKADFFRAWFFALFGVYGYLWHHNYNPFLWTMMIELWGALIVFAFSQNDRFLRDRYTPLLLCAALAAYISPIAACFCIGALIALAERDGFVLKPGAAVGSAATIALPIYLILAAVVMSTNRNLLLLAALAVGVFLCVRYSFAAQRLLTTPLSRFLGRISFPLYLVQFPIIASFGAQLIIWADANGSLTPSTAYGIAAATTIVSLLVATLFLPIETGTLALIRRIDRYRASRAPVAAAKAQA